MLIVNDYLIIVTVESQLCAHRGTPFYVVYSRVLTHQNSSAIGSSIGQHITIAVSAGLSKLDVTLRDHVVYVVGILLQVHVLLKSIDLVGALPGFHVALIVHEPGLIEVSHAIGSGEDGNDLLFARRCLPLDRVKAGLYVPGRYHMLVIVV